MITVIILISFLFIVSIISKNSMIEDKEKVSVIVKLKESTPNMFQGFVVYEDSLDKQYYYSSTDSYLILIDKDKLEALRNNENIELISEEQVYHATLEDALPLSNVTLVQSLFNLTGKGQTVCILDTGINYSHQDLGNCSETDFLSGNCNKIISGYDFVNNDNNPYDDAGHGSHVSGIVSRTAPDAKIISVKVLDENGDGSSSIINAGIDFCINHKEEYNISVISMSLGGGLYSNYCNNEPLKPFIDAALSQNITVVASAGNDFSKTKITGPACINGVTSVSALNKDNSIASYSNRNKNTVVLAIGSNINSTSISGNYETMTGTSMSTPLVSGAIALLNQYQLKNFNIILSPQEINLLLKNNGNNITDSTGLNYSGLNMHKLLNIISINDTEINNSEDSNTTNESIQVNNSILVNLISPINNLTTSNNNLTFECSASSNSSLTNISLYLGNSTSFENKETKIISGNANNSGFNITLENNGNYFWNCLSFNNLSVSNFSSENFSIIVNISQVANLTVNTSTQTENTTIQNSDSSSGSSGSSGSSESSASEPQALLVSPEVTETEQEIIEDNQKIQYKASNENIQLNTELQNQNIESAKQGFFSNLMTGQAVISSNLSINRVYITIFLILIILSASGFIMFKMRKKGKK
ncbi:S8 family serine peptidase [Candidatus Woesearchaeota archaeon]|nr:S8 family serine peptidase [Candidatus Woesearchaeota archaeon]